MTTYLRCWCCREEFDIAGRCACTAEECWRGEQCKRRPR